MIVNYLLNSVTRFNLCNSKTKINTNSSIPTIIIMYKIIHLSNHCNIYNNIISNIINNTRKYNQKYINNKTDNNSNNTNKNKSSQNNGKKMRNGFNFK